MLPSLLLLLLPLLPSPLTSLSLPLPRRAFLLSPTLLLLPSPSPAAPSLPSPPVVGGIPGGGGGDGGAALRSILIPTYDKATHKAMIEYYTLAFAGCRVLRTTSTSSVLGFGPDVLSPPSGYGPGVSSPQMSGGHSTITLSYGPTTPRTRPVTGQTTTTTFAYLQISHPSPRISKLLAAGEIR